MDNISGPPVEGNHFFGRTAEIAKLRELLDHHDILLLGPRRIGKTSIARAVMRVVRGEDWATVEINVAACQDEREFLNKLEAQLRPALASFADKIKDGFGATLDGVAKRIKSVKLSLPGVAALDVGVDAGETDDWISIANDLLRLIAKVEQRWLIYIDELPIFLFNIIRIDPQHGVQRVRRFLDWFRNDVRALPGVTSVRWLVSGSVGLDTLVQQHGMADTINSLKHESLPAFSDDTACAMLGALAARYQIAISADDCAQLVAAVLWPQPYYLQVAFHHLRSLMMQSPGGHSTAAMTDLITQAIAKMAEPGADNDFHHWEMRLEMQLTNIDAAHCLALLTLAAETAQGAQPETLLAKLHERLPNANNDEAKRLFIQLRDILQRDAYWWPDASSGRMRYRFRLEPLRLWWLRRNTL
jgi:hypothetical protein